VTPYQAALIQSAQDYDLEHRPLLENWTRVGDEQVLRLLLGAKLTREAPPRPCTLADQARWAMDYIKDHYGPGSKYAREHAPPE
jgi:hypothetical protein